MPDTPAVQTEEEVMFFDTDIGGVVHNLAYLRFIETARTRLAACLGLHLREMTARREFPVLLRTEIDYRQPATLGDVLHIHGKLDAIARVRFWCSFRIVRPEDDTLLVTCRQQLAIIRIPSQSETPNQAQRSKPLRLPSSWAADYPHLVEKSD